MILSVGMMKKNIELCPQKLNISELLLSLN